MDSISSREFRAGYDFNKGRGDVNLPRLDIQEGDFYPHLLCRDSSTYDNPKSQEDLLLLAEKTRELRELFV